MLLEFVKNFGLIVGAIILAAVIIASVNLVMDAMVKRWGGIGVAVLAAALFSAFVAFAITFVG